MSEETRRAPEPAEDPLKIATGMTLADISIRNHVFAWILMFALIGFGLLCFTGFGTVFRGLGISQNPDIDVALQDVQSKLSQLQRQLPVGIDPPVVSKTNPEDDPIMRIALGGSRPP